MQSQTLWVAFFVLVALFVAAIVMRAVRRLSGRKPTSPLRAAAPAHRDVAGSAPREPQ